MSESEGEDESESGGKIESASESASERDGERERASECERETSVPTHSPSLKISHSLIHQMRAGQTLVSSSLISKSEMWSYSASRSAVMRLSFPSF